MNSDAIILMVTTMATVTAFTSFFFYKVLTMKPKPEPDSYAENDEVPRPD